jgi:SAM-dependent methyltransferase
MATATTKVFDHRRRSAAGCLSCGSHCLRREAQPISGFLAARAWQGRPELTELVVCEVCGLRFFERGLDDDEASRYYQGYRDSAYQQSRQAWEPFYTARQHAATLAWSNDPARLVNLRHSLAQSGAPAHFGAVLDHGGGEGHMLAAVDADRKAVFDPSGGQTVRGRECYAKESDLPSGWNLVLCCQVLEHISFPSCYLRRIHDLLADDGWLYIEVPNEHWRSAPGREELRKALLKALLHSRPLLIAADMLCTASRIKLGRLPPLGFVAMREHINYFTQESLSAVLAGNGFQVESCGIDNGGQLFAVARKFGTNGAGCGNTAAIAA